MIHYSNKIFFFSIFIEAYWGILEKKRGSEFLLSPLQDEIYNHFIAEFPEYKANPQLAMCLDEDAMKSKEGKARWRTFMNHYEKTVKDYNFGTMLRRRADQGYTEENTMFSVRMQFLAIEIFRNKHKMNDWVYEEAQKEREKQKESESK